MLRFLFYIVLLASLLPFPIQAHDAFVFQKLLFVEDTGPSHFLMTLEPRGTPRGRPPTNLEQAQHVKLCLGAQGPNKEACSQTVKLPKKLCDSCREFKRNSKNRRKRTGRREYIKKWKAQNRERYREISRQNNLKWRTKRKQDDPDGFKEYNRQKVANWKEKLKKESPEIWKAKMQAQNKKSYLRKMKRKKNQEGGQSGNPNPEDILGKEKQEVAALFHKMPGPENEPDADWASFYRDVLGSSDSEESGEQARSSRSTA